MSNETKGRGVKLMKDGEEIIDLVYDGPSSRRLLIGGGEVVPGEPFRGPADLLQVKGYRRAGKGRTRRGGGAAAATEKGGD